jgi:hypothetical protein
MASKKRSRLDGNTESTAGSEVGGDGSEQKDDNEEETAEPPAQKHKPSVEARTPTSVPAQTECDISVDNLARQATEPARPSLQPATARPSHHWKMSTSATSDPHFEDSHRFRQAHPHQHPMSSRRVPPHMPPPLAKSYSMTAFVRGSKDLLVRTLHD